LNLKNAEVERLATEVARLNRDGALAKIGVADAELDVGIGELAVAMAGCKLGARKNPFTRFSRYSVATITRLAYRNEIAAVRELVAKVAAEGPPEQVTRAIGDCLQKAAKVEQALKELSGPQGEFDEKRGERDAAAMDWSKAFEKLKLRAQLAYEDAPVKLETLFAPPEGVQRPLARRGKKAGKQTAAETSETETEPVEAPEVSE
jgi:hypothetical protein